MDVLDRNLFRELEPWLEDPQVLVLYGARQTGKSTTLLWWLDRQAAQGRQTILLDCEDPAVLEVCNAGSQAFLASLRAQGLTLGSLSVALDEVQYLDNPSSFLKLLHDHHRLDLRLAVSGSSSFALKSKFQDSLVGRTIPFEVFGLDFREYTRFLGKAWDFSAPWPAGQEAEAQRVFRGMAETGSYPGLVGVADRNKKARMLRQILQTYVQTDVRELGRVRYPDRFDALIRVLASQVGSQFQTSEVANSLRMARETVEEYVLLLEQTYVIRRLRPFFRNVRSELTKSPKVYFEDNGLLALSRSRAFSELDGVLLENAVFGELRKACGIDRLRYWRTSEGHEVDFIVDEGALAIEVKLSPTAADVKSLLRFGSRYPEARLVLSGLVPPRSLPPEVSFVAPWHLASLF